MTHPQFTVEQAEEDDSDLRGGLDILSEAHTKTDATDPPTNPSSGLISYSGSGHEKYASSDGNDYNTGRLTVTSTGATSLTTSMQTIGGLSAPLAIGTYRIHAQLLVNNPGTAGQGAISYRLQGTGGLTASNGRTSIFECRATSTIGVADYTTLGTTLTSSTAPGTGGANHLATFDGYFIISVAGTINVQASQAATAASSIVQYGTYLEVFPVT